jgi:hypothetical protein
MYDGVYADIGQGNYAGYQPIHRQRPAELYASVCHCGCGFGSLFNKENNSEN